MIWSVRSSQKDGKEILHRRKKINVWPFRVTELEQPPNKLKHYADSYQRMIFRASVKITHVKAGPLETISFHNIIFPLGKLLFANGDVILKIF